MTHDFIYLSFALAVAVAGAVVDVRSRTIPNALTYPAMVVALLLHMMLDGSSGVGRSVAGALLGGALLLPFFAVRAMGGGDVKLMAAACACSGLSWTLNIVVACALSGGLFALALMVLHHRVATTLRQVGSIVAHHAREGLSPHPEINLQSAASIRMPYGLAIAAGVACALARLALER